MIRDLFQPTHLATLAVFVGVPAVAVALIIRAVRRR
jgi:hypothetical protein